MPLIGRDHHLQVADPHTHQPTETPADLQQQRDVLLGALITHHLTDTAEALGRAPGELTVEQTRRLEDEARAMWLRAARHPHTAHLQHLRLLGAGQPTTPGKTP